MTPERHVLDELHDLLDGRVTEQERVRIEEHLAGCATCRAEWDRLRGVRELLRRTSDDVEMPPEVTARVAAALDREAQRRPWTRVAAAALAAAAVVAIFFVLRRPDFPAAAARDYVIVQSGQLPLEHRVNDPAELERWFGQRVRFPTRVFDFAMMQYQLLGGSVDSVRGRPSALFAYRGPNGDLIVCQMYEGRTEELPPAAEKRREKGIDFFVYEREGATVVFWQEGAVVCVLTGAGPRENVIALAAAKAMKV